MQNPSSTCPQCQSPIPADAPGGLCPACALLGVAGPTNPSQAAAAHAPTLDEVAAAFPELEVLELIGQGGMGVVFKARQPRLDRLVALKILPPALAAQPGFAERFTREARVLARLAHPHIVGIYDFGESAGFFYLIMEFVNGVNLRAAMRAGVKPEQALLLVPHICEALQFAHDHGVLHRDIKPENILLDTAGTPKLADFGIAKLAGEESMKTGLTATGAALGTAAYMAPEQIEKPGTVDHRADIYSLGVVLYEMLTGELPLGRFASPSEKSRVGPGVDEVVMRALEKERERRQQSATEMKTQVEGASRSGSRTAVAAPSQPSPAALVTRIFVALTVVSAVGIPVSGILRWTTPAPGQMVALTILFGTLTGLSKLFAPSAKIPAAPRGTADSAPNPWPNRLFWLIVGIFVLPLVATLIAIVIPQLTMVGHDHRSHVGGWAVMLVALLPAFVGAALFFGYRRTRPGADRATPRATWNPWPKRVFLLLVAVVVAPVLLLSLGFALPMLAYRSLAMPALAASAEARGNSQQNADALAVAMREAQASPAAVVTAAHAPFIGELSQGSIELVAISQHPAEGKSWWRMNGEPALEGPFINYGSKVTPIAGEQACEFVFHTKGLPPDASSLFWEIPGPSRSSGGTKPAFVAEPKKPLTDYDLIAAAFPASTRETQIRAGIALDPWHSLAETRPGNSTAMQTMHGDLPWKLTFGTVVESKEGETVATYSNTDRSGWVQRLVAVTLEGQEIAPSYSSRLGEQAEARFAHLPLNAVASLRLQVRPIQWVEFRGVPLVPAKNPARAEATPRAALLDEAVRLARQRFERVHAQVAAGVVPLIEENAAARDLAIAEARGDAVKIAQARVRFAEGNLGIVRANVDAGVASREELETAEAELNAARQELDRAPAAAAPTPSQP